MKDDGNKFLFRLSDLEDLQSTFGGGAESGLEGSSDSGSTSQGEAEPSPLQSFVEGLYNSDVIDSNTHCLRPAFSSDFNFSAGPAMMAGPDMTAWPDMGAPEIKNQAEAETAGSETGLPGPG